jgi:pimeloyl-ACP methyl ester carboxylesterase
MERMTSDSALTAQTPENTARDEHPEIVDGVALYPRRPAQSAHRPPIVLAHGGMHGAWVWADMQEWLAQRGWRSVAFDFLSHGRSRALPEHEWVSRSLTEGAFEIDVACASVADAPLPPVVLGWSMGGLSVLAHAATSDRPLSALVLLCPVVPAPFGAAAIPLPVPVDPGVPFPAFPPEVARALFYDGLTLDEAAPLAGRLQAESPRAVIEATQWTGVVDVTRIHVPTLAIGAENDRMVPSDYVHALADALPAASFVYLPGAGHGTPVNPGWPTLISLITDWLDLVAVPMAPAS